MCDFVSREDRVKDGRGCRREYNGRASVLVCLLLKVFVSWIVLWGVFGGGVGE